MAKRVLLAEPSDTIRGVATTILRQNGFEVISVGTAQKALEVLNHSQPNLIIINSLLTDKGGNLFHERIMGDSRFAATPIMLFAEPNQPPPPCPEESIIRLPFEPKEFLQRVSDFIKPAASEGPSPLSNPLGQTDHVDDVLDAALGLDRLEVTDSEVMDKTQITKVRKPKVTDKMIGYDHTDNTDTGLSESSRVESIVIQDENSDIHPNDDKPHHQVNVNASGKLDILGDSDQYGMVNPGILKNQTQEADHDYDWCINEMQREAQASPEKAANDSGNLSVTNPSSMVDPITPPPPSVSSGNSAGTGEGVERFIDEFRKEVDKIHDSEPDSIALESAHSAGNPARNETGWEDSLERIGPEQIRMFKREFVILLAEKIAGKIVDRIDSEKLLNMLKNEIMAQYASKNQDRS